MPENISLCTDCEFYMLRVFDPGVHIKKCLIDGEELRGPVIECSVYLKKEEDDQDSQ